MKTISRSACLATTIAASLAPHAPALAEGAPAVPAQKVRVIALADLGNEVDDQQSLVRLLLYANDVDIEGLVATTSSALRDKVHPEMIAERLDAYERVLPNLRVHAKGYPDVQALRARARASTPTYGMGGVGDGKDSDASRLIIAAVDRPDPRPVWITIWGGAKDLAQALWTVRATRNAADAAKFVAKLRVYSISDQDDAGPWARAAFPELFWITSIHAFWDFNQATWAGMNTATPAADAEVISKPWIRTNIQAKGPLGALYPTPIFGVEGDSPSFLYLLPNGLGSSEHPDWGSWGGRYGRVSPSLGLWSSATDSVRGLDGQTVSDNRATVWRWRRAFQNDLVARMDWSVQNRFGQANHPPGVMLNGQSGEAPVEIAICPNQPVRLSARGTTDPDGQPLRYRWWQYREASGIYAPAARIENAEGDEAVVSVPTPARVAMVKPLTTYRVHIILEVTDAGTPALTRYRRAVLNLPDANVAGSVRACGQAG